MTSDIKLKLGKRIKELRSKKKITQEKLADSAAIDYKYLQTIEGKDPPNIKIETIERIAKALNVKVSALLDL
jgi:transcriptional regulator with XRE-family HTH domain